MPTPISIVIPAFNQLNYCQQCVQTILTNTERDYRLILVDNGSTDGVAEFFDSVPGAVVIHAETNRGFAGGVNLGLETASGHVVLLNSDTLVPRGWLGRLETALLSSDDIGMVGPMSNYASGLQQIDGLDFSEEEELNAFAQGLAEKKARALTDTDRLVGFCMLIREEALSKVGLFDESFGLGNYEDDDYCLRTRKAGYRLCVAEGAFVFHYGNRTFLGMGMVQDRWQSLMAANQRRFMDKWDLQAPERVEAAQRSEALNARARSALDAGDTTEAIKHLRDAIEVFPLLERNYNDLGAILWQAGMGEEAFRNFAKAIQLNPAYVDARDNLRDAAGVLGKEEEAAALLGEH